MNKEHKIKSLWEAMLILGITKIDLVEDRYKMHKEEWKRYIKVFVKIAYNELNLTYSQISEQLKMRESSSYYYQNEDKYLDKEWVNKVTKRYKFLSGIESLTT